MEFIENRNPRLGESYYKAIMQNGLTVSVYPMPQKEGIFAMLSARIGSVNRDFTIAGRHVRVPAGIAHFLEHKLFENENEDAFSLFARTGASANAYTSFDRTCYLFMSSINTEESLRTLIRFVTNPVFTKETVQKEQGIIGQEIKMYDDNPEWVLSNMILRGLYVNHPLNEDIAGTVESIAEITPELLYDCYNAFYRPSNMILSVAGNITPETVALLCEQEYKDVSCPTEPVNPIVMEEPYGTAYKTAERSMSIFENMFGLGYKMNPLSGKDRLRDEMTLRILLGILADSTGDLYRNLYDQGLINDMFDFDVLSGEDYLCTVFSGESREPDQVIAAIKEEIERQKVQGIDGQRFLEAKRAYLGGEICSFDSIESVASRMTVGHFKNYDIFGIMDILEDITKEDVERMLQTLFFEERSTIVKIIPNA